MTTTIAARSARAEAEALVGAGFGARVLEPSPPAVTDPPFFADDPVAIDDHADGTRVVVPAGMSGDLDWDTWLGDHPASAELIASRWLGGIRRLPAAPSTLATTRLALHRLATYVIAPVRHAATGKFGLRWTLNGFGTPFFAGPGGEDRQIRVDGTDLVDQRGGQVRVSPITTLAAAAAFLDAEVDSETAAEHDSPDVGDSSAPLEIDLPAARFIGAWFGMAFAALELLRADEASIDPSRPQLWPGHFDPAIEVGDEDHRASFGASPGDDGMDEPYLYVSIWWPDRIGIDVTDPAWNAPSFTGSVLRLSQFPTDTDPVVVAHEFWAAARDRLG